MGRVIEGRSTSSAARAEKSAARAPQNGRFLRTPGFSPGAPPREGFRGRVRPRQCTTPTVLRAYSHVQIRCTRQIRRACQGTPPSGCVNTPLFDPFTGTARGRAQVPGGQHACLTPAWRQSRCRATYWLCGGRGEPSDSPHTTGNPAHGVRNGACTRGGSLSLETHCITLANPVGGVPSRVRRIRRFPTPHTHPLRGPAPGLPPGRRQTRVLPSWHLGAPLALCPRKDRKGAYSHTHSAGFPGAHAGSDGCTVFTREIRPIKRWGLCTGAAA